MRRVLAFGTFDPLHPGHLDFLRQARVLGDHLIVVVARDSQIRATKKYEPHQGEDTRLAAVQGVEYVDQSILGNKTAHHYELLSDLDFDILVLGYDQAPADDVVRQELARRHKQHVHLVRLKPHQPEIYKSSLIRPDERVV